MVDYIAENSGAIPYSLAGRGELQRSSSSSSKALHLWRHQYCSRKSFCWGIIADASVDRKMGVFLYRDPGEAGGVAGEVTGDR